VLLLEVPGGLRVELLELLIRFIFEKLSDVTEDGADSFGFAVAFCAFLDVLGRDATFGKIDVA
jgi:hypothetical protein